MALLKSIKNVLGKTRALFSQSFSFLGGKTTLDEETLEHLETLLLKADFGIVTTEAILTAVTKRVNKEKIEVIASLKTELKELLCAQQKPFIIPKKDQPTLILMLGVNGAGKTTSIGKMAYYLKNQGFNLLLAAGDTFRAAATHQLAVLAERVKLPLISQGHGSDSASVIYDALQSATSKQVDVVIADTAGRLQNKQHLMEELKKIARVLKKLDPAAPHEVILVLDAGIGQNALRQVREFNEAVPLTGMIVSKLDGTAKAGIIFAISAEYKLPIYFLGTGESVEDLQPFDADEFVEGLFHNEQPIAF